MYWQSCSRGTTCNFIHCFRNPGGDYEWADLDKPPPRYWLKKMAALFGYTDESVYDRRLELKNSEWTLNSYKMPTADSDRFVSFLHLSCELDSVAIISWCFSLHKRLYWYFIVGYLILRDYNEACMLDMWVVASRWLCWIWAG